MDPRKLKVNELKEQLQLAGLSVNGKKEELVARLTEHLKTVEELNAAEPVDWDESKFDVDDLAPPPPSDPVPSTTTPAKKAPGAAVEKAVVEKQTSSSSSSSTTTTTTTATTTTASTTAAGSTTQTTAEETKTSAESIQFQGSVGSADVLQAEHEKRKNRAARFGIPLKEQDKAIERAARFGVAVNASTTVSLATTSGVSTAPPLKPVPAKPGSTTTQIPADVLNKRRERFGIQAPETTSSPATPAATSSKIVLDAAEEEKKRKRAAKFGLAPDADDSNKKVKV
ncbi:hypothetical protein B0O80DRAFT_117386 [Mortierella sp. GBAus27b]|nr:hypothetical protein B0O80DRAFT_117386 [Mortierella sp. GBAus27b]